MADKNANQDVRSWAARFSDHLTDAVAVLGSKTTFTSHQAPSHRLTAIAGWAGDGDAERAIARYLVGLRMMMVSAALSIQSDLLGDKADSGPSVILNVEKIVGKSSAPLTADQIAKERNPWIAEALWHLCLHLSTVVDGLHPNGRILALDYAHSFAKEQGLDIAGLYSASSSSVGLTIVETKAYEKDPAQAVINASAMFRSINQDKMDVEIRRSISIMRQALPIETQALVTGKFWADERTYIPNPHYDSDLAGPIDWKEERLTLKNLGMRSTHVNLMPNTIVGYSSFFTRLSDNMRVFAEEICGV